MGTNLFGDYFNNPAKAYIYSNMVCNSASADEISFNLSNNLGVISDNEKNLATIDLSDIHVPLTQYSNDMKTLQPYEILYIKGMTSGESYMSKSFGKICKHTIDTSDWEYLTTLHMYMKYTDECGIVQKKEICAAGSYTNQTSFIDVLQKMFDDNKIAINVSIDGSYIVLTSTVLGFEFWIFHIELYHFRDMLAEDAFNEMRNGYMHNAQIDDEWTNAGWNIDGNNSNDYNDTMDINKEIYRIVGQTFIYDYCADTAPISELSISTVYSENLFEDLNRYVGAYKYKNGAMKGIVVLATYPKFNADSIADTQRSLKIAHITDRIEEYYDARKTESSGLPMYVRVMRDVADGYYSQYDVDAFRRWSKCNNCDDSWFDAEKSPYIKYHNKEWTNVKLPNYYVSQHLYYDMQHHDAIGIHGYANYLTKHNLWSTMGQVYIKTSVGDDESTNNKNMIPGLLIYNPNPFPVVLNYMTFA